MLTGLIEDGASVADIGTDHGYLPVYLAQIKSSGKIIASDISAYSVKKALKTAEKHNVTDKITFFTTPGLDSIGPDDVDTIVIAGLGGETILHILEDAPWTKNRSITLILQPQSKFDILFRFLYDNGYGFKEIKYIFEKSKRYTIIQCGYDG